MLAIQFKFCNYKITFIDQMQRQLSKHNTSNLHKQASQTLLQSKNSSFMQQISSPRTTNQFNSLLTGQIPPSYIQNTQHLEASNINKLKFRNQLKNRRHMLVDIEERIFGEVLQLLDQIDQLKSSIFNVNEQIQSLQIQYPHIDQQVKFHGYSQRLTQQQCNDLEEENSELIKQIEEIESHRAGSLDEVLKIQKEKYQELKNQLSDSSSSRNLQDRIKQLKKSIVQLENLRNSAIKSQFPQFDQLKWQNQELRQKTLAHLNNNSEQRQLIEYLNNEQISRMQFMEELKKFKAEYNRIKNQNQNLRDKINKRYHTNSKENSNMQNRSKAISNKSSLGVESKINRRKQNDRLSEYESHIKLMQYSSN